VHSHIPRRHLFRNLPLRAKTLGFMPRQRPSRDLRPQPNLRDCANWVLGHILVSRHVTLRLLSAPPVWDQEALARYGSGSDPIRDAADGRRMEDLLRDVDGTQHRIEAALRACTEAELERIAETNRGIKPVWQHVEGLHWHETYHIGQFQILRNYVLSRRPAVE